MLSNFESFPVRFAAVLYALFSCVFFGRCFGQQFDANTFITAANVDRVVVHAVGGALFESANSLPRWPNTKLGTGYDSSYDTSSYCGTEYDCIAGVQVGQPACVKDPMTATPFSVTYPYVNPDIGCLNP